MYACVCMASARTNTKPIAACTYPWLCACDCVHASTTEGSIVVCMREGVRALQELTRNRNLLTMRTSLKMTPQRGVVCATPLRHTMQGVGWQLQREVCSSLPTNMHVRTYQHLFAHWFLPTPAHFHGGGQVEVLRARPCDHQSASVRRELLRQRRRQRRRPLLR